MDWLYALIHAHPNWFGGVLLGAGMGFLLYKSVTEKGS